MSKKLEPLTATQADLLLEAAGAFMSAVISMRETNLTSAMHRVFDLEVWYNDTWHRIVGNRTPSSPITFGDAQLFLEQVVSKAQELLNE